MDSPVLLAPFWSVIASPSPRFSGISTIPPPSLRVNCCHHLHHSQCSPPTHWLHCSCLSPKIPLGLLILQCHRDYQGIRCHPGLIISRFPPWLLPRSVPPWVISLMAIPWVTLDLIGHPIPHGSFHNSLLHCFSHFHCLNGSFRHLLFGFSGLLSFTIHPQIHLLSQFTLHGNTFPEALCHSYVLFLCILVLS